MPTPIRSIHLPALAMLCALAAPGSVAAQAPAAPPPPSGSAAPAADTGHGAMLPHRAVYRLSLDRARSNPALERIEGTMVYEVVDACNAWAGRQRLALRIEGAVGGVETVSDSATLEAKDGRSLRFAMSQATTGQGVSRVSGEATLGPDGSGSVRYAESAASEEALPPGTMLPMGHTIRALREARGGGRILVVPLFDGTSADGAQDTTTVVLGGWSPADPLPRFPELSGQGSARMRVAFFDRSPAASREGAATPDYEVGLRLYANGVADEISMIFGDFTVNGALAELVALPSTC